MDGRRVAAFQDGEAATPLRSGKVARRQTAATHAEQTDSESVVLDDAQLAEILFAPLTINEVTLKNRIVMSPMSRRRISDPILRAGVSAPGISAYTGRARRRMRRLYSICTRDDPQPSGAANVSIEPQEAA